jgi:two-component system, NarL family, sensor kinase
MLTDAMSNTSQRQPLSHSNSPETAWADMLSRIGQKNSRLYEFIARDSCPRCARPGPSGHTLLRELERERSRIARDLHAGAGQPLAGIKLNLEMLDDCAAALSPAGRDALNRLQILTEQALQQVRAVSHNLHPPDWQGLTTEDAIRHLVLSSGLGGKVEVDLDLQPLPEEPSHAVKVALYRCAQECISNVARHSEATRLAISLRSDGPMLEFRLQDNGRGLPEDSSRRSGIGLVAIREHAADLGGTCEIASSSTGVRIVVRLPGDPD